MITLRFVKEKDTKNAVRFQEVTEEGRERAVVGSIYILKSDLEKEGNPDTLIVTIDAGP